MVSQILWKQAERGETRAKSEELCRVEELCDHLNDKSFEDVTKDRFYFVEEVHLHLEIVIVKQHRN